MILNIIATIMTVRLFIVGDGILTLVLYVDRDHGSSFGPSSLLLSAGNGIVEVMSSILIGSTIIKDLASDR